MDDTQRLRIFRPNEDDPVIDVMMGQSDLTRPDRIATQSFATSGESENEVTTSSAGILTQTGGLLRRFMLFTGYSIAVCLLTGCTALRPLHGIPVRQLPREFRGTSRANMETIDLLRLSHVPRMHIVDSGDILGVYVNGVLGKIDETPPVYIPQNGEGKPTIGLPIPVRDDGTISLPQIPAMFVRGMTERQVEDAVRREYVQRGIRAEGTDILVSLQRARSYKVTVLRQETPNPAITGLAGGGIQLGATKRGTGQIVTLPAGENDVLRALTMSGGLPGLDAQNAIYVLRQPHPLAQRRLTSNRDQRESWPTSSQSPVPLVLTSHKVSRDNPFELLTGKGPSHSGVFTLVGHSLPAARLQSPQWGAPLEESPEKIAPWNRPQPPAASSPPPTNRTGYSTPVPDYPAGERSFSDSAFNARQSTSLDSTMATDDFRLVNQTVEQLPIVVNENHHIPEELHPYMVSGGQVFRIPVRLKPGEVAHFSEEDVLLYNGDIIFIESRDTEIFYTGGLLGGGQFSLPRDYDLDVIDAISIAQGRGPSGGGSNQIGGIASVNQDISVSASNLVVIRRLADGRRVNIKIDVNKALRDENENLLVQPGDHLILRYTPIEAVGAFVERNLLAGSLIGLATQASTLKGTK